MAPTNLTKEEKATILVLKEDVPTSHSWLSIREYKGTNKDPGRKINENLKENNKSFLKEVSKAKM